jgi:hypothetical protein
MSGGVYKAGGTTPPSSPRISRESSRTDVDRGVSPSMAAERVDEFGGDGSSMREATSQEKAFVSGSFKDSASGGGIASGAGIGAGAGSDIGGAAGRGESDRVASSAPITLTLTPPVDSEPITVGPPEEPPYEKGSECYRFLTETNAHFNQGLFLLERQDVLRASDSPPDESSLTRNVSDTEATAIASSKDEFTGERDLEAGKLLIAKGVLDKPGYNFHLTLQTIGKSTSSKANRGLPALLNRSNFSGFRALETSHAKLTSL